MHNNKRYHPFQSHCRSCRRRCSAGRTALMYLSVYLYVSKCPLQHLNIHIHINTSNHINMYIYVYIYI